MTLKELTSFVSTATEAELRAVKIPPGFTLEDLAEFINALNTRQHDYGTCVYAMSLAAYAAFVYIAHSLNVSGFQASCADMDFIRRTRRLKLFAIIDLSLHLFPQYNLPAEVQAMINKHADWYKEEAAKELAALDPDMPAHPEVVAHWKKLAGVS